MEGLNAAKVSIEGEHTSCHRVVQPFYGNKRYEDCYDKVWIYDWAPAQLHGSTRKSCRMVVIVPEPNKEPLRLIAGTVYWKSSTIQLSLKQLAAIFLAVTAPTVQRAPDQPEQFRHVNEPDGLVRSICNTCYDAVAVSADITEIEAGQTAHDCPGSPF